LVLGGSVTQAQRTADYLYFVDLCKLGLFRGIPFDEIRIKPSDDKLLHSIWVLFRLWVWPLVQDVYNILEPSTSPCIVYRGMSFATQQEAGKYLDDLLRHGFHEPESFTTDVIVACRFAVVGDASNVFDAQLQKFQYPRSVNSHRAFRAILTCVGYSVLDPTPVHCTSQVGEHERWVKDTRVQVQGRITAGTKQPKPRLQLSISRTSL